MDDNKIRVHTMMCGVSGSDGIDMKSFNTAPMNDDLTEVIEGYDLATVDSLSLGCLACFSRGYRRDSLFNTLSEFNVVCFIGTLFTLILLTSMGAAYASTYVIHSVDPHLIGNAEYMIELLKYSNIILVFGCGLLSLESQYRLLKLPRYLAAKDQHTAINASEFRRLVRLLRHDSQGLLTPIWLVFMSIYCMSVLSTGHPLESVLMVVLGLNLFLVYLYKKAVNRACVGIIEAGKDYNQWHNDAYNRDALTADDEKGRNL